MEMEVSTNQPAVQFYSGNFLKSTITGKSGVAYGQSAERFAPSFPSAVLRSAETCTHTTQQTNP